MKFRDLAISLIAGVLVAFLIISLAGSARGSSRGTRRLIDGWQNNVGAWEFRFVAESDQIEIDSQPVTARASHRILLHERGSFHSTWYGRTWMKWIDIYGDCQHATIHQSGQIIVTDPWDELSDGLAKELAVFIDTNVLHPPYRSRVPTPEAPLYEWVSSTWSTSGHRVEADQLIWTFAPGLIVAGLTFLGLTLIGRTNQIPVGCCIKCGYDQAGLAPDTPCPECGKTINKLM